MKKQLDLSSLLEHKLGIVSRNEDIEKFNIKSFQYNEFNFLDDYDDMFMSFIEYHDELYNLLYLEEKYQIFGKGIDNYFVIECRTGKIISITIENSSEYKFVYCNTDLNKFCKCYCLLMSCVYNMRISYYSEDNPKLLKFANRFNEKEFLADLYVIDPSLKSSSSYWGVLAEELFNGDFSTMPTVLNYMKKDRFE